MMKSLSELDHYEVLEVARGARPDEIERAFTLVRGAYEGDALAAYSVIPPDEAKLWRERIDEAFRVLSDPAARSAYDDALAAAPAGFASVPADPVAVPSDPAAVPFDAETDPFADAAGSGERPPAARGFAEAAAGVLDRAPLPAAPDAPPVSLAATHAARPLRFEEPRREGSLPRELEAFDEAGDDEGAEWTGPRLRRARILRGLEIDDVAAVTKVNPTYLRFLEEERFDGLPALVYVRGFVSAYARMLGIESAQVAPSYAARYEEHRRQQHARGRPHGRSQGR
ncbi:MAG: helix-turn-helix domain-containing protein [Deltaproteobacteria bacterium]|nr:helix-turn-helix domain-containing protein [Deltaproteobacteria bacterium]